MESVFRRLGPHWTNTLPSPPVWSPLTTLYVALRLVPRCADVIVRTEFGLLRAEGFSESLLQLTAWF